MSNIDIKDILSLMIAIPVIIFVASAAWTITSNPGDPDNAETVASTIENVVIPWWVGPIEFFSSIPMIGAYLVLVLLILIKHFNLW